MGDTGNAEVLALHRPPGGLWVTTWRLGVACLFTGESLGTDAVLINITFRCVHLGLVFKINSCKFQYQIYILLGVCWKCVRVRERERERILDIRYTYYFYIIL